MDLVREHITARTKVCSLCHIDTITGVQLPMAEIDRAIDVFKMVLAEV